MVAKRPPEVELSFRQFVSRQCRCLRPAKAKESAGGFGVVCLAFLGRQNPAKMDQGLLVGKGVQGPFSCNERLLQPP